MKQVSLLMATLSIGCMHQLQGSQVQISKKNKVKPTETIHPTTPASQLTQKIQEEENQRNSDSYVHLDDSASGFSSAFSSANLSPQQKGLTGSQENSGESSARLTPIPSAPDMAQDDGIRRYSDSKVHFDTNRNVIIDGESDDDIIIPSAESSGQQNKPISVQDIEAEKKIKEEQEEIATLAELKRKTQLFMDGFDKILHDANKAQNLSWNELNKYDEPLLKFIENMSLQIKKRDDVYNEIGLWRFLPQVLQPADVRKKLVAANEKYTRQVKYAFDDLNKSQGNSTALWYAIKHINENKKEAEFLCSYLYNKRDSFVQTLQKSFNQRPYHYALGLLGITVAVLTLVKTNKK